MTDEIAPVEAPVEAPMEEQSPRDAMSDAYDRAMASEEETTVRDEKGRFAPKGGRPEVEAAPEGEAAEEAAEAEAEAEEAPAELAMPTDLPKELAPHWAAIPEEARTAIAETQRRMASSLADLGRRARAFEPIQSAVMDAAKSNPDYMNMTPDQIAADLKELQATRSNLLRNPVQTMAQVAELLGVTDQLAAHFTGGQQGRPRRAEPPITPQSIQAIVQQAIAQDRQQAEISTQQAALSTEVDTFAKSAEHWEAVAPSLARFVEIAQDQALPGTPEKDILEKAYTMAVNAFGLKASAKAAAPAPAKPDPRRAEAAIRAKSVNVTGKAGKPSAVTAREAMAAAYDRAMTS